MISTYENLSSSQEACGNVRVSIYCDIAIICHTCKGVWMEFTHFFWEIQSAGQLGLYSDSLRAVNSADRIPVWGRDFLQIYRPILWPTWPPIKKFGSFSGVKRPRRGLKSPSHLAQGLSLLYLINNLTLHVR